jgi:hypothetical protein
MAETEGGRGSVGAEIFDEVERLVSDEGINRSEAFQRISERTGRRPGTVAANYYRIARQRGAPLRPRRRRGTSGSAGRGRRRAGGDVQAALTQASAALDQLGALARRQEQEIARLRDEVAGYAEIKRLAKRLK